MGKLTWSTCLLLVFLLVGSSGSATTENVDISWSTFQGNAAHTGYVPISLVPEGFEHKWDRTLVPDEGTVLPLNPVTAADGKVFVSLDVIYGDVTSLFALDAEEGAELWSKDFGLVYTVNPPSYAGGKVYIQTVKEFYLNGWPSFLRAFDADTGKLAFESEFEAQWVGYYAPTIYDGTLYMNGGYYGGMYAYNISDDGLSVPEYVKLPQYDEWTPAVNDQYVYAYVGSYLYAIDRNDISVMPFSVHDPGFDSIESSMRLAPVIGEQNDILVIQGGRLISFDLPQQRIRWVVESNFTGQPSVAKGVVYAIDNGALTAWDEENSAPLWSWQAPDENLTGTMIVTDTHVLAGTESTTYAIDLETHEDVWSYYTAGHLTLGNDSLYIASSNGTLTAISIAMASSSNDPPIANAGPDMIGLNEIMLDGSKSYDPDGEIVSYVWQAKHRGNGTVKRNQAKHRGNGTVKRNAENVMILEGESPTLSDFKPGFYDVTLTVTDDDGNTAEDTIFLVVAGKYGTSPQPNAAFDVKMMLRNSK